jgi:glycosyltransferase involved in cell wall biosynthesis
MIAKNEAAIIGRCLKSIRDAADEIIVVDTGSTDATVEIAEANGAKVVHSAWRNDFAFSRNVSIEHASGAWILWLDADDIVPVTSIEKLKQLTLSVPDKVYGFTVRNERPGNTGTEFIQARMFPNRPELRFERSIHEQIMPSALRIGMKMETVFEVVIEHHGYADGATLKKKALRNLNLLLVEYPLKTPDPVMASEIADSYWLNDNTADAEKWYREVIRLSGSTPAMPALVSHALYGVGNIANKNGSYSDAIGHFEAALTFAPWRSDVYYSLAVAQELKGDTTAAVLTLEKITKMNAVAGQVGVDFRAAKIKAYLRRIRLLAELEDKRTESVIDEAVAAIGDRPELQNLIGKYYLKTGTLMKALHAFEKSLNLRKEGNSDAYIGLCIVYKKASRMDLVTATIQSVAPLFVQDEKFLTAVKLLTGEHDAEKQGSEMDAGNTSLQREFFGVL